VATFNRAFPFLLSILAMAPSLGCRHEPDADDTSAVGAFDGLFDDVATGFNFPLDIGIAPDDPVTEDDIEGGDIYVANYGTSEIMRVLDPSGGASGDAAPIFDGTSVGLAGAMAVSVPHHDHVWAAFEQGGANDQGGIAVLDGDGTLITTFDSSVADAFFNPGGICFGGWDEPGALAYFYLVNFGDGSAWRISVSSLDGTDPTFTRIGSGLATGTTGNPGSPGNPVSSNDLPEDGARGCVYAGGSLYVADAQNARIVRFDDADVNDGIDGVGLEDLGSGLVTYPTDVAINEEGYLIIISYDNAHAFVAVELPTGRFIDNGLHDLNVNSGNYGTAVASGTIWFTRANNTNGALRAITPEQDLPPTTEGPFPPQ
jgi:hypothetical protein